VTVHRLPRSLDPLPDESLPGYVLRLAHRLDVSPARIASLTGLSTGSPRHVASGRVALSRALFALDPDRAATFADATRLTTQEVTKLTLTSLGGRYPPLDTHRRGRQRQIHGISIKESWVLTRATRYCPRCLAGDGTVIQRRHGGAWSRLWRLPVVFACTTHRRLLQRTCPACGTAVHQRPANSDSLLPAAQFAGLHPASCRHPDASNPSKSPCAHRLDAFTDGAGRLPRGWDHSAMLALQQRLLDLIRADGPTATASVGMPTTPGRYFVDLRIVSCLLTASWPAGRDLITEPAHARVLDEHAASARRQIKAARAAGQPARPASAFDRPPLRPSASAALFTLADRVLNAGDPDIVRQLLRPLVDAAPSVRDWIKGFLADDGPCSSGLQAAVGTEVGAKHVVARTGISRRPPQPLPQPVRFGPEHIPQYLPARWLDEHFSGLAGILDPRFLRRAVPVLLARTCTGGGTKSAAQSLDLPQRTGKYAIEFTTRQLSGKPRRQAAFRAALDALTANLDTATTLIDYGRRRAVLRTWSIAPDEWRELITDLIGKPVGRKATLNTDWGDSKRLLASTWIWTSVTEGEPHFAPITRPDPARPRPGGQLPNYIHSRWPFIATAHGHYADLRQRLDSYASQLATEIDESRQVVLGGSTPSGAAAAVGCAIMTAPPTAR